MLSIQFDSRTLSKFRNILDDSITKTTISKTKETSYIILTLNKILLIITSILVIITFLIIKSFQNQAIRRILIRD